MLENNPTPHVWLYDTFIDCYFCEYCRVEIGCLQLDSVWDGKQPVYQVLDKLASSECKHNITGGIND